MPDRTAERYELRRTLESRGLTNPRVLDVIEQTPRDLFVPSGLQHRAYEDEALGIGEGQTISQPYIVALMTDALELRGDERVLEIGTGSGYQTAILAQLCREVVTLERIGELTSRAQPVLAELGLTNIEFHHGDGSLGWPVRAPYDAIIVTAAAPDVPAPLYRQLENHGRLVIPVGSETQQMLKLIVKHPKQPVITDLCECRFVKLIGDAAWEE